MKESELFHEKIMNARTLLESAGWREGSGHIDKAHSYILMAEQEIKEAKAILRREIKERARRAA